jgi:Sulfotransferase domain
VVTPQSDQSPGPLAMPEPETVSADAARWIDAARDAHGGSLGDSPDIRLADGRLATLFFVCGHPKSGTNWVGALVNLHPLVRCRGEYRFEALRRAFDTLERQWWHVAHAGPVKAEAERCFRASIVRIMLASQWREEHHDAPGPVGSTQPERLWLGDRTPRQLGRYIAGAMNLYVVRDPRDVAVSWTHQEIREAGVNFSAPLHRSAMQQDREAFVRDPEHFLKHPERLLAHEPWVRFVARRYVNHVGVDLDIIEAARCDEIAVPTHVVRYERLHQNLQGELASMLRTLGCDATVARTPSHETRTCAGFGREDPLSFFRKGDVGEWRRYYTPQATAWFQAEAQGILERLGYVTGEGW